MKHRRGSSGDPPPVDPHRYAAIAEIARDGIAARMSVIASRYFAEEPSLVHAVGFGGLCGALEFLIKVTAPHGHDALRRWVDGYVRAAFADAGGPIDEKGRPMGRLTDA